MNSDKLQALNKLSEKKTPLQKLQQSYRISCITGIVLLVPILISGFLNVDILPQEIQVTFLMLGILLLSLFMIIRQGVIPFRYGGMRQMIIPGLVEPEVPSPIDKVVAVGFMLLGGMGVFFSHLFLMFSFWSWIR